MTSMNKTLATVIALALALAFVTGCRVEGEVDPDGSVSSAGLVAR